MKLFGVKKTMTQVFDESGRQVPVTVVDIADNHLTALTGKDGFVYICHGKKRKPSKSEIGAFKKLGFVPEKVSEFKMEISEDKLDQEVSIDDLTGKTVKVTGTTKGKGFQGVVKRWGFHGGPKTHGQSDRHRAAGSIGSGTTPGRVYKGKKMPGRMGGDTKTLMSIEVVKHLPEEKLLLLKGAIPGNKDSLLEIEFTNENK
jgi:large subunit ribosomal protein L3